MNSHDNHDGTCGESGAGMTGTPGSGDDPSKRAGRKTSTALWVDLTPDVPPAVLSSRYREGVFYPSLSNKCTNSTRRKMYRWYRSSKAAILAGCPAGSTITSAGQACPVCGKHEDLEATGTRVGYVKGQPVPHPHLLFWCVAVRGSTGAVDVCASSAHRQEERIRSTHRTTSTALKQGIEYSARPSRRIDATYRSRFVSWRTRRTRTLTGPPGGT